MVQGSIYRGVIGIMTLPDKAYTSISAVVISIYRMTKSKKNLLEWTTSEEAERKSKKDIKSDYKNMFANILFGIMAIAVALFNWQYEHGFFLFVLGILWEITPLIMWWTGKNIRKENKIELLDKQSKEYIVEVAKRTWMFFKDNINENTKYLPPDNYQEDRKEVVAMRTSSTNIGLRIISCYIRI